MTSRPAMSIYPRLLLGLFVQGLLVSSSFAQDLSIVSDFGTADFSNEIAQIFQNGNSNKAQISQSHVFGGA